MATLSAIAKAGAPAAAALGAMLPSEEAEAAFVGRLSKLVKKDDMMLNIAQKMDDLGLSREEIFDKTGWFRDQIDGEWKLEVPGTKAKSYRYDAMTDEVEPLADVHFDPELYPHYPELADIPLKRGESQWSSHYQPSGISGTGNFGKMQIARNIRKRSTDPYFNTPEGIFGHEIQHAIQDAEGFAKGGSPTAFIRPHNQHRKLDLEISNKERLHQKMLQVLAKDRKENLLSPKDRANLQEVVLASTRNIKNLKKQLFDLSPEGQYDRLAGEVEARNVTYRDLDEVNRYTTKPGDMERYPWNTAEYQPEMMYETAADSPYVNPEHKERFLRNRRVARSNKSKMMLQQEPGIQAPAHPNVMKAATTLRDISGKFEGHPLGLIMPGEGTANWLTRLAYKQKPSWSDRFGVLMDWL